MEHGMTNEQAIGTLATYVSLLGYNGYRIQEIIDQFATEDQKGMVEHDKQVRADCVPDGD